MPNIRPSLLLVDRCQVSRQTMSDLVQAFAHKVLIADGIPRAQQIAAGSVIDLLICNTNVIENGSQTDEIIGQFHRVGTCQDLPVLFICSLQRSKVRLKKHAWGAAYHVCEQIDPSSMIYLVECSLSLRVNTTTKLPVAQAVPQPMGLSLPEVILPSAVPSMLQFGE